jgi:tRNA dimethylallyltransferase
VIVLLSGPTASGKTRLACQLADVLPVHLISMDSAMVYRGMDIGTAKPTADEQKRYPHQLIDIRDPAETYSAADFVADADAAVRRSTDAGRIPVIVGGTMLYARAFREGLADLPSADEIIRASILARAEREGWPALHAELAAFDPITAAGIHPNNRQRLQRALEIVEVTGKPVSQLWQSSGSDARTRLDDTVVEFKLQPQRALLHRRIEARFDDMLASGFLEEVRDLREREDLHADLPSMRAVGYRQMWRHLDGQIDFETMRFEVLAATRQLAKKQETWLRSWPDVVHLEGTEAQMIARIAQSAGLPIA